MQTFLDRLIAQGVFGSLPAAFVYTGMMFLFGVLVVFVFFRPIAGITSWLERRVWSRAQSRVGPNRVGPQGALQWLADSVKLLLNLDTCQTKQRPYSSHQPRPLAGSGDDLQKKTHGLHFRRYGIHTSCHIA